MMQEQKLLKIKDIMTIYGVSRGTVYNWVKRGMPVVKKESIVRFEADKVDQWFKKN